jgi:hypothetical protein
MTHSLDARGESHATRRKLSPTSLCQTLVRIANDARGMLRPWPVWRLRPACQFCEYRTNGLLEFWFSRHSRGLVKRAAAAPK